MKESKSKIKKPSQKTFETAFLFIIFFIHRFFDC